MVISDGTALLSQAVQQQKQPLCQMNQKVAFHIKEQLHFPKLLVCWTVLICRKVKIMFLSMQTILSQYPIRQNSGQMNGSRLGEVKLMAAKLQFALGGSVSLSWKATGVALNKENKP